MGGTDKVWTVVNGHPIVWYSLHTFAARVSACVLVVRDDHLERACRLRAEFPALQAVAGGAERQESVLHGLQALPPVDIVAVHDVARPFTGVRLLTRGIEALERAPGAVPVVPISDTVKQIDTGGFVVDTVDRQDLRAIQTPQLFRADALWQAHTVVPPGRRVTDDAGLLEAAGYPVATIPGDPANFKITTTFDLMVAEIIARTSGN